MQFCLLGPLLVLRGGTVVPVQAGKQRTVLATLLLNANHVVPVEELAETLWGPAPPPSARVTVQNYVLRLRKALGEEGHHRIATQPRGYVIRVADGELDTARFEVLLSTAQRAARDGLWEAAAAQARAALALWRGEPLADVESELLASREVPRLADLRLQALETRIDADLHLGRHAELTGELRRLAAAHPLREHLHALLMLALYRDGRQAEALTAYQAARRILIEELGTDPGAELRALHQQMLTADAALAPPMPVRPASGAECVIPQELPANVRHFTGRARELTALTALLDETADTPGTVVISAIGGSAGVGKTALAVHWAHQVAGLFPDGQLYVNLRGYDRGPPVTASDALAGFLRALGVPGPQIPAEEAERAARYRSVLAGRKVLVIADNAASAEQVRPLLPGASRCTMLVTSRDSLAGLVAGDGATRLDLDVLPLEEAVALLRTLIGARVEAEPVASAELAGQCCRLPLALRVAAELAASRPAVPLAGLTGELADLRTRLDLLDAGGDPRTQVRTVFSWSYRHLDADAARTFRLAGLHPGATFEPYTVAALTGTTVGQARQVMNVLARAHLIQPTANGHSGMHDLLRVYARELAASCDGAQEQRAALTRLFDYYLSTAAAAMDVLFPAEARRRPRIPPGTAACPAMPSEADAGAWLDRERANLVAVVVHCAGHGWPRHASGLASTLFRYLMTGSHLPEAQTVYSHALQAARGSGDLSAEAEAHSGLGAIGLLNGRFRDAAGHYQAALERHRECGDQAGQARALHGLGVTEQGLHNYRSAGSYHRQAIAVYEDAADGFGAARALTDLADTETELGCYDQAAEHLQRALPVFRDAKHDVGEGEALTRIGELNLRRGQLTQAAASFTQALAIYRRTDQPVGVANALFNLGQASLRQGEYPQAISYLRQALALHREVGGQYGEILTLRLLAEARHRVGQPAAARGELAAALRLAAETGNTYQQASAHRDLAESHHGDGQADQARYHWQQAFTLYTQLGAPEADQVRSRLSPEAAARH